MVKTTNTTCFAFQITNKFFTPNKVVLEIMNLDTLSRLHRNLSRCSIKNHEIYLVASRRLNIGVAGVSNLALAAGWLVISQLF